jgi:hypothetical protein
LRNLGPTISLLGIPLLRNDDGIRVIGPMGGDCGILLVAYGNPSYWDEATTLAKSLRHHWPSARIAVASDLAMPERRWRSDGFDCYVPFDFRDCGGVSFKMHLDRITPYRDATLFIDSDTICYRDISGVFDAFSDREFVALGKTLPACHWFDDSAAIRREFSCDAFPFFCGDFYLFRQSATAGRIFDRARDIAGRHKSLGIKSISGWCNDEPAFSLAMAMAGVSVSDDAGEWIVQVAHSGVTRVDLNFARGEARVELNGAAVIPRLVHFSTHRSQPLYFRERYRVRHAAHDEASPLLAHAIGTVASVHYRACRKLGM